MDWVDGFYSRTGRWWGAAEGRITERDHHRVDLLHEHAGTGPLRVLELGPGYGTTAVVTAQAGHDVTAVEISDRADRARGFVTEAAPGTLTVIKDDFFRVRLDGRFDVVTYFNGFGVGSDADQRRLLTRIATEWLRPGGVALIDVYNPFVWAGWHDNEEHRMPDPARGYEHELHERTTFDPVTCAAIDTWWDVTRPDEKITQVLRCYTPADLALLLGGTGLHLKAFTVGDRTLTPGPQPGLAELLAEHHEYLAVLRTG
ncbi:class I SAM-dependent methyltransferase [Actinoplanes friuliensis]|uniref:Type 11 methyltransferase n=1 Tax=Actinoplanes friuliensis DSM 7358 TaxID=1246995 RepID=U5VZM2_9ACTN|nr:class I SAM-dependent methyltransferase [Actinoplanes friuliensis]AGZ42339.1 type 11 methyltransferase [Actinoplanes friuliensis DSM 7358]